MRPSMSRRSVAVYLEALLGWCMLADAALIRPGVSMGYFAITAADSV